MDQFRAGSVEKRYVAVVQGRVKKDFDTITISIYNRKKRRAEPAVTKYRVLGRGGAYTPQPEGHARKDMEEWPSGGIQLRGKRNPEKKEAAAVGPRSFTVLEVETLTGRTNQIRVHMAAAGHPLVGESVYSFRKDFALRFKRAALHASHIGFAHPATGKPVSFDSPLPEDMKTFFGLR
jgi:23S rRNA-/tRNA-specific pseudouridylate synthase